MQTMVRLSLVDGGMHLSIIDLMGSDDTGAEGLDFDSPLCASSGKKMQNDFDE